LFPANAPQATAAARIVPHSVLILSFPFRFLVHAISLSVSLHQ